MKIGGKLATAFGVVTVAMLAIAVFSFAMLTRLAGEWTNLSEVVIKRNDILVKSSVRLGTAMLYFRNYIFRGGDYSDRFMAELDVMDKLANTYRESGDISEEEKALLDKLHSYTDSFREQMKEVIKQKAEKVSVTTLDFTTLGEEQILANVLQQLTDISNRRTESVSLEITRLIQVGRTGLPLVAAIAALIGIVTAVSLLRSIIRSLRESVNVADRVAAGDLTSQIEVSAQDETGQLMRALQRMNEGLRHIVSEVRSGADFMASAVSELAIGHNELSRRTESQAASLEQTASSMEEFTNGLKQTANNAMKADKLTQDAAVSVEKGSEVVNKVVNNMDAINTSSKRVADITGFIEGIAFQTNILALNAAVEAARAGDQGRGFAVVASEVRDLAKRSAEAAKEIKSLIKDSTERVEQGAFLVRQVSQTMDAIVAQIREVSSLVAEISRASKEQSEGIQHVNIAVNQIENVTQQNAALVEEATAATTELYDQAKRLAAAVAVFRLADSAQEPKVTLDETFGVAINPAFKSKALPRSSVQISDEENIAK
jgi:methyl-accepting chemotaxis protein